MLIIKTGRLEKTFLERACTVLEKKSLDRWFYQNNGKRQVWRRRETGHYLKHTILCAKHGGGSIMAWVCVAANRTRLLMEAGGWILKYTGLYTLLILNQMLKNWSDGASQLNRRIMQKKGGWRKSLQMQSISTRKIHSVMYMVSIFYTVTDCKRFHSKHWKQSLYIVIILVWLINFKPQIQGLSIKMAVIPQLLMQNFCQLIRKRNQTNLKYIFCIKKT